MAARSTDTFKDSATNLTTYEIEREDRILRNKAKMAALGIPQQVTLFEAAFKVVKKPTTPRKSRCKGKGLSTPSRSSSRLLGSRPEFHGLSDDFKDGLEELPKLKSEVDKNWTEALKERRCDSLGRGSLYDSKVGITCHFCRQKKLCGEPDCKRCSDRNADLNCSGKSACSQCASANGRFCRACLLVRYGLKLEEVQEQMETGTWLCPHCYEEKYPDKGWICNSSICMTRRGMKPTGIAIFDAQQRGFPSVAHDLQARLLKQRDYKDKCAAQSSDKQDAPSSEDCIAYSEDAKQTKEVKEPKKDTNAGKAGAVQDSAKREVKKQPSSDENKPPASLRKSARNLVTAKK